MVALAVAEAKTVVEIPSTTTKAKPKPSSDPLEGRSVGTRVLFDWATWLKKNGAGLAESMVTFKKDTVRLLVHVYRLPSGTTCGVLKIDDSLPRAIIQYGHVVQKGESSIREFREWNEALDTISAKLLSRGWVQSLQQA